MKQLIRIPAACLIAGLCFVVTGCNTPPTAEQLAAYTAAAAALNNAAVTDYKTIHAITHSK